MRISGLLILMTLISCGTEIKESLIKSTLTTLGKDQNIHKYTGDTVLVTLSKNELDRLHFPTVDSLFYETYMKKDKNFKGLNADFGKVGGPICNQYFYGVVNDEKTDFRQILILQVYNFNDTVNDLFLLTFDKADSLTSILQVASIINQPEIEPVFKSKLYRDRGLTKYEIIKSNIPENIDSLTADSQRFQFCTDSITKEFKFTSGQYQLTKKDSLRICVWKSDW
jgi:hypothetical protein